MWPCRWVKAYPQFKVVKEKLMEQAIAKAMNVYMIRDSFHKLEVIMREHDIFPEDFWNMDEMGL